MAEEILNRDAWRAQIVEAPIDPDLPIIDAHHHIWPEAPVPDLEAWGVEALLAYKAGCGHNIAATVFVEAGADYRSDGPAHLAPVGETEFAERVARDALACGGSAAGAAAGIIAAADMMLGDAVDEVLLAHREASPRLRGIRFAVAHDVDMPYAMHTRPGMMAAPAFRAAFGRLAPHGLNFDVWLMQPQIRDLADLAGSFPDTTIVLDHLGTPMGVGRFAEDPQWAFDNWRALMADLAGHPNVSVKLGGLNMPLTGLCPDYAAPAPWPSERIAAVQRRHVLTAIDLFGPERCMFESNFPVDRAVTSGTILWNAYKRMVGDFTDAEKRAMFHDNAVRIYRLEI